MKTTLRLLSVSAVCLAALFAPLTAHAQVAPTIVGWLSNFDVPNDVKDAQGNPRETEGFEIQIEGVQPADVIYAFGEAGALAGPPAACYIRYCKPQIIQYATGIYVRWTVAGWDPLTHQFTLRFNIPGMVVPPFTPPIAAGTFFAGHQCLAFAMSAYPTAGCEHFGVTLTRNPVATTYRWVVGDPSTGVLTYTDGTPLPTAVSVPPSAAVPSVPILAPAAQIVAGQVEGVILAPAPPPPPPAALAHRYGLAQWVKVYKKEIPRQADLDELVGGHPNENVPGILGDNRDVNAVAETEWKLLQLDTCNTAKGGSQLVNHGGSSHGVVRRYEFYKYAGPVVAPGGSTGCGGKGAPQLSTDDQEASLCTRDPVTQECLAPGAGELGDFIGAQNAAQNLDLNDGRTHQSITFAALTDRTFPHAALTLNATASSNLAVTFGAVGTCSVVGNTLSINGAGGCVVTAYQAGDATFAPASDVLRSFLINLGTQTITFALPAGPFTFGDAPFQVSATSSAGLPVTFSANGACSVQGTTVTITGAGLCDVTASQAGDGNFAPAADVLDHTTIAKAAATVTFDAGTLSQIYSGSLKTVATTTAPPFLNVKLSFTGAPQNAGSYPVTATIDDFNYTGSASDTLVIARASAKVLVAPYSVSYDGLAHAATGSATGVLNEVLAGLDLSGTSHTTAGSYAADGWTFTDITGNYSSASGTVADRIAKVDATVAVNGFTGIYDGAAHGASGTAKGVNNEDLSALLTLGASFTNAPGGSALWSFSGDANYNAASGSVTITINKADPVVSTSGGVFTYDGAAHGSIGTASVAGSFAFVYTPGATAPVNASATPYAVTATFTPADPTNYNAGSASNSITINKASSTVTVTCPASVVSTGAALTPCTAAATGAGMPAVDVTASLLYSNNVTGPTATATATWAGDANHIGSSGSGSFLITAPPVSNPLVNPGDQTNHEGDEVELRLHVTGAGESAGTDDDDSRPRGTFSASGLPPQLHIEKGQGVIRGHIGKNAAGQYPVTVSYTRNGVTYSQGFAWTVLVGESKDKDN